jgi:deazaflavin-dependent oxidoreductase (nitroreductase family)
MPEQIVSPQLSTSAANSQSSQRPAAFMIPLMKMPLFLYRLGLGWFFGKRFVLITHVGRRSGKVYRSVLAILKFDAQTQEMVVVSPWSKSNWYRNIQAEPALEVETGEGIGRRLRYKPEQRNLLPEEIAAAFIQFRREHPIFSRIVARIPGWKVDSSYAEFLELARSLRGVAFRPSDSRPAQSGM